MNHWTHSLPAVDDCTTALIQNVVAVVCLLGQEVARERVPVYGSAC